MYVSEVMLLKRLSIVVTHQDMICVTYLLCL